MSGTEVMLRAHQSGPEKWKLIGGYDSADEELVVVVAFDDGAAIVTIY